MFYKISELFSNKPNIAPPSKPTKAEPAISEAYVPRSPIRIPSGDYTKPVEKSDLYNPVVEFYRDWRELLNEPQSELDQHVADFIQLRRKIAISVVYDGTTYIPIFSYNFMMVKQ